VPTYRSQYIHITQYYNVKNINYKKIINTLYLVWNIGQSHIIIIIKPKNVIMALAQYIMIFVF